MPAMIFPIYLNNTMTLDVKFEVIKGFNQLFNKMLVCVHTFFLQDSLVYAMFKIHSYMALVYA